MIKVIFDDIFIIRGDTGPLYIEIETAMGDLYTPTDTDKIIFTVKRTTRDNDALIQKFGNEIIIEPTDTADLPYGEYVYDVQLNIGSFVDTIILPHKFVVCEEVTF